MARGNPLRYLRMRSLRMAAPGPMPGSPSRRTCMDPSAAPQRGPHILRHSLEARRQEILSRTEWIQAARQRLWDRMDRLRRVQQDDDPAWGETDE